MVKVLQKGTGVKGCKKTFIQDNKNNILLENNDKVSSSKQTNHIKTPYLFVRGRVAQFGLEIEHYPMERMWSNILPNPPKGRVFRQFRAEPMNFPVDYEDEIRCKYLVKTTGVSDTNVLQADNPNAHFRSYTEGTRAVIKYPMYLQEEFFGGIQNT